MRRVEHGRLAVTGSSPDAPSDADASDGAGAAAGPDVSSDEDEVLYEERLTAPVSWWIVALFGAVCTGLIALRFQGVAGVIAGAVTVIVAYALMAAVVMAYGRVSIRVTRITLQAGKATLPLRALGEADALDEESAAALRGPESDVRAFMLLRGYVRTAVRVEVVDPADPTPYLYLSSRRPAELARTLRHARSGS